MFEQIRAILRGKIFESKYVYLDVWSIVHFITGYLLWSVFNLEAAIVFILIVLYEIIEPALPFFRPETKVDAIWDVIIRMIGYYIARGGF